MYIVLPKPNLIIALKQYQFMDVISIVATCSHGQCTIIYFLAKFLISFSVFHLVPCSPIGRLINTPLFLLFHYHGIVPSD